MLMTGSCRKPKLYARTEFFLPLSHRCVLDCLSQCLGIFTKHRLWLSGPGELRFLQAHAMAALLVHSLVVPWMEPLEEVWHGGVQYCNPRT